MLHRIRLFWDSLLDEHHRGRITVLATLAALVVSGGWAIVTFSVDSNEPVSSVGSTSPAWPERFELRIEAIDGALSRHSHLRIRGKLTFYGVAPNGNSIPDATPEQEWICERAECENSLIFLRPATHRPHNQTVSIKLMIPDLGHSKYSHVPFNFSPSDFEDGGPRKWYEFSAENGARTKVLLFARAAG